MKRKVLALLLCGVVLLSGCSLLNREYSSVTPHSASYYESGSSSVLRAENYQDLVNDILVLAGQHKEEGTVWLYLEEDADAESGIINACREVQQDTPMGSYALDYLTYQLTRQHNYWEIALSLGYRRTAEQQDSIVHITSLSALQGLLSAALEDGREELTVQLSYFNEQPQAVYDAVSAAQAALLPQADPWEVTLYPAEGTPGIAEIILKN